MSTVLALIEQFGLIFVFANVLLEQLGLPLPAYPTLLLAGVLIGNGQYPFGLLLAVAVFSALLADTAWYLAGRKYGKKVLGKLCKISLSPDTCVRQTEALYLKLGPPALLVCKFIPGFASISSALAGAAGTRYWVFMLMDGLGAALWAGSALWLGYLFSSAIDQLMLTLVEMGKWGTLLVLALLAVFIASRWWDRQRFIKSLRMARISVEELNDLINQGRMPVILDTRATHLVDDGWIPGAQFITLEEVDSMTLDIDQDTPVVLYCACPNEVTAARVAKRLINRGYRNIRPLSGGIDAWRDAGYVVAMPEKEEHV
ncbi:membrane protein DedA, SNARE-associated domain [Methylophilus rhizosphaerae]|uniref:Membrane protein DedA, SNARE-associated domain n=1 Tax=Methylophilus rhizosphaerae TaxID=492660 RepID=A0A1G9D7F8_9PROT|nr:DedA family protein/thiosulfate sulfurtransferase GlpE [Methylophilus rhizosphaerae]SDK59793.1 membrane protein DedA, SNARE-associated domain [Methylophilus rhizosphaerae]